MIGNVSNLIFFENKLNDILSWSVTLCHDRGQYQNFHSHMPMYKRHNQLDSINFHIDNKKYAMIVASNLYILCHNPISQNDTFMSHLNDIEFTQWSNKISWMLYTINKTHIYYDRHATEFSLNFTLKCCTDLSTASTLSPYFKSLNLIIFTWLTKL